MKKQSADLFLVESRHLYPHPFNDRGQITTAAVLLLNAHVVVFDPGCIVSDHVFVVVQHRVSVNLVAGTSLGVLTPGERSTAFDGVDATVDPVDASVNCSKFSATDQLNLMKVSMVTSRRAVANVDTLCGRLRETQTR